MRSDAELVQAARAGQTEAYELLVQRWARRVAAICRARVGNVAAVDDLTQETLLRGWKNLSALHDPQAFGPWLRGIAGHVCLDWLRGPGHRRSSHARMTPEELQEQPSEHRGPVAESTWHEQLQLVRQQIDRLPEDCREVVLLHYYDQMTYDEMAHLLGVARATINARLARARVLLAGRLSSLVRHTDGL